MNILVINGAARPGGTTTRLAEAFMDGARAAGAETEMVMLRDRTIAPCTDCLACYDHEGDGPAPCALRDDMEELVPRIAAADGLLFASPVHCGFVTGRMAVFWERLAWRTARPDGPFLGAMALRSRLNGKVRALASIVSAGGMPERLRSFCDDGTRWLKGNAPLMLHGAWIGDLYAGAELERRPESPADWRRLYHLRRLGTGQLERARALGTRMADTIRGGRLRPVTMESLVPGFLRRLLDLAPFRRGYPLATH